VRSTGVCVLWGIGIIAPAEQLIATQWSSWESSSWTGETWLSCREVQHEVLGFCVPWGNWLLVPPAEYQVIAFLPLVGNLAFFLLMGEWGPPALRASGKSWASVLCGERSLLARSE
jgi:hypothetical protein